MYATFPPGIPGVPPGHLFASTPFAQGGSGGPYSANHSSSFGNIGVGGSRLNFSNPQDTTTTEPSSTSLLLQQQQSQHMYLMLQTVYHQQQALQAQVQQLCLAMHQLQVTVLGSLASHQHLQSQAPPQFQPAMSSGGSGERRAASTESYHDHPAPQHHQGASKDTDINPPPHTPSTPVMPPVPTQQDPPRRSPSKRGVATPNRSFDGRPPPPDVEVGRSVTPPSAIAGTPVDSTRPGTSSYTSGHPTPHQVVVTWEPKRQSRSSSVNSNSNAASHATHRLPSEPNAYEPSIPVLALHQQPVTSLSRSSSVNAPQASHSDPPHSSRQVPRILSHVLPQYTASSTWSETNSHNVSVGSEAARGSSATRQTYTTSSTTNRNATQPTQHSARSVYQTTPYPSYHDVSLSDDGYVSMDSAQYIHRFHLK